MTYVTFSEVGDTGKTKIWDVVRLDDATMILGQIRWFGRWRQYTFRPATNCVFSSGCLADIQRFIDDAHARRSQR